MSLVLFGGLIFLSSCDNDAMPKPRSWFRIDIPEHGYVKFDSTFPYTFEYADYAQIEAVNNPEHPYWINVYYPKFKAKIYISYNHVDNNIVSFLEDAHTLAFKHISKANDIRQAVIIEPEHRVYGLVYYIKGNDVASPLNFYVTDSVEHFLRASLYFNMAPHNDSLEPVIEGIEKDLKHLVKSLEWKELD
jgi:gliding motility-associated lipoprotein GldD